MKRALRILAGIAGPGPREAALRRAVAGRIVVVTGASEGIGAATALRLGAAGATVVLVARTADRLDEVRRRIEAAGGTAAVHPCDLADPAAAEALAADLLRRHGRVDVVVSNAGHSIHRSVAATAGRFHDIARTAGINYLGPVALLLGLLPAMRAAGGGHIVNVSSASLAAFAPGWSAYLASKGAFDIWLRTAAPELRRDGVRVSTVYFGMVRTRMSAPTLARWRVPAASPEEAAAMVCRAVVRRPRTVWPWWARLGQPLAVAFPAALERCYAAYLRLAAASRVPRALSRAGLLRPRVLVRVLRATRRYGATLAAALAAGPRDRIALIDADPLSAAELAQRASVWATHLAPLANAGRVGLACAPGREFVIAAVALGQLGLDTVLLSPDTPAARLAEVAEAHDLRAVVHDGRYDDATVPYGRSEGSGVPGRRLPALDAPLSGPARRPGRRGRLTVLTSGSTGVPKEVVRALPVRTLLGTVATHLELLPLGPGRPFVLAAPPHHGYGLAYLAAGLAIGAPVVLAAGLDAAGVLDLIEAHEAPLLVALPVQLHRIAEQQRRRAQQQRPAPSSLRAIVSGAAPLPAQLHTELVQAFGDIVFNLYGTTEAGWSAIATPKDLAVAPGTVGRAPHGVSLCIRDAAGHALPPGAIGEVHVRGWLPGGREVATGDLGHLDAVGRLHLHGRTDEMIVSGGVNVYPSVVAAALAEHPAIAEVRVCAVDDPEFGQRLAALVRPRTGAELTADDLRAWQRAHLPPAQRPRDITLVDRLEP